MYSVNKGVKTLLLILSLVFLSQNVLISDPVNYSVKKGDTLFSIAQKYNIPVDELKLFNQIKDPTKIKVGTTIKIPPQEEKSNRTIISTFTYRIKPGDTLFNIAKRFSVPIKDLLILNNLTTASLLKADKQLKIPSYTTSATTASATEQTKTSSYTQTSSQVDTTLPHQSKEEEKPLSVSPATTDKSFWPHPGQIRQLSGKLSSTLEINGQPGDEVLSVSAGKVTWAGLFRGYGKMVFIKSPKGYVFAYGGNAKLNVKVGDSVTKGQSLGNLGLNPNEGEAKVFFCVSLDGKPVNPYAAPR